MKISKLLFIFLIMLILGCVNEKTYKNIADFQNNKHSICQHCNDSILDNTMYRTLLLRKEEFCDSGINTLEELELLRLHLECSDSLYFNTEIALYNKNKNRYVSTDNMDNNIETVCNDCGVLIVDKPYYTIETRLEKQEGKTVIVEDAVGLVYLCESCTRKYNLRDLMILEK